MCARKWTQAIAVTLACCGMVIPDSLAVAQEPEIQTPNLVATDVALQPPGCIVGTIVDQAGQPIPERLVTVQSQQQAVAHVRTDDAGRFVCPVPCGGVYLLQVDSQVTLLRCWLPEAAPPHAVSQLLWTADGVVRGQISPAGCGLGSPWVIMGVVATAIVIPVIIYNHRADRNTGS